LILFACPGPIISLFCFIFSSRTTPEIIVKTFSQYFSYVRRGKDIYLEPAENFGSESWLVFFVMKLTFPRRTHMELSMS
jgi:hypothetical protein